jgi:c-di-AMP phosphodiesterase-like protein
MANMMGLILYSTTAAVFVNMSWILTSFISFLSFVGSTWFYIYGLEYTMSLLLPAFAMCWLMITVIAYYCEKKFKSEYLLLKHNERMHYDLRKVLENLPEGVLLFNPQTKNIVIGNNELKRLFANSLDNEGEYLFE